MGVPSHWSGVVMFDFLNRLAIRGLWDNSKIRPRVDSLPDLPFCNQPWSTLYVHWDGTKTMPCVRGPQAISVDGAFVSPSVFNCRFFVDIRSQILGQSEINNVCGACLADKNRCIDHLKPFANSIASVSPRKAENYWEAIRSYSAGEIFVRHQPVVVILDISSRCHIRCRKCFVYNSDMKYHLGHMSDSTFDSIKPLLSRAILVIGHENGESMLNPNFLKFVRYIKDAGCRFTFNTTGLLMNSEMSAALVSYGVEEIMFSIDSINSDTYNYLHVGGSLDTVLKNISCLNKHKRYYNSPVPRIGWYLCASRINYMELPAIVDYAIDNGFGSIYVAPLNEPNESQNQRYHEFYKKENLKADTESASAFQETIATAKSIANGKIEFRLGS